MMKSCCKNYYRFGCITSVSVADRFLHSNNTAMVIEVFVGIHFGYGINPCKIAVLNPKCTTLDRQSMTLTGDGKQENDLQNK